MSVGGKLQLRAASSAALRNNVGPSEFVTQTFPFSSTIANTLTVPDTPAFFATEGYERATRLVSLPLSDPVLISFGSSAESDATGVAETPVSTCLLSVDAAEEGVGAGFAAKGLGIREATVLSAGGRPS